MNRLGLLTEMNIWKKNYPNQCIAWTKKKLNGSTNQTNFGHFEIFCLFSKATTKLVWAKLMIVHILYIFGIVTIFNKMICYMIQTFCFCYFSFRTAFVVGGVSSTIYYNVCIFRCIFGKNFIKIGSVDPEISDQMKFIATGP